MSQPSGAGGGVVDGAITVYHGTKKPVEEEVIQGGVVAGARFSPVQNPAGARGSGLVGRDLLAPRPSGWSTGLSPWDFSPGISPPEEPAP